MLHNQILLVIGLLFVVVLLHMLSVKIGMSFPILLVLGGLAISILPYTPSVVLDPDLLFLIFLPPLLYEAAWSTSWKDFWRLRGAITVQALGLVIFTSLVVAYFAHALIPGFSLAAGFVLGGIISPPDAMAAASVLHKLRVPKDAVTILEGESLINDASSLIVFQFALIAILTNSFVLSQAATRFVWAAAGGIAVGLVVAQGVFWARRTLPTTPSIDTLFTLLCPYLMYLAAESTHTSGVLAVVAGGLLLSYRANEFLSGKSRVQAGGVWDTLSFLLNGIVFIMIGLQLPLILKGLGDTSVTRATWYAVSISLLTIAVRIIWVFPTAYLGRLISLWRGDKRVHSWEMVMLVAWAGMRGVVSLATALSVPLTLTDGSAFPHRNLILYITFCVILATLVVQGLTLPWLIRLLKFQPDERYGTPVQQRESMSMRLALAALEHLDLHYEEECKLLPVFTRLRTSYEWVISSAYVAGGDSAQSLDAQAIGARYKEALRELIGVERKELILARREGSYDHELTREREDELNLEEARLQRSEQD
jgi:monovalent cation/hydrogen antiporter